MATASSEMVLDANLIGANVRDLVEALDVEQILPHQYAAYRPLLVDGLCFFLEHIPSDHLAQIIADQLALPPESNFADRVLTLLRLCPTLHKMGQVISREPRLSVELRRRLQRLESLSPNSYTRDLPPDILAELDSMADIKIADRPIAEASVALVVPFTWYLSDGRETREGVFKILKPGVRERLHGELDIWAELGAFLAERCQHYDLPVLDYKDTLDSVRRLLQQEVNFELEQRNLSEAASFYASHPSVVVPQLLPFCTKQITAMERVDGVKVPDADIGESGRRRLARTLIDALVAKPFWDPAEEASFHADPHAGNLCCTNDGRLAIFDWTLVGRLSKAQRGNFVQIVLGALTLNEPRICRAVSRLARTPPDESRLRACVSEALKEVRQGCFPGFDWSQRLLDRIAIATGSGFPDNLVLFRKAILTLSGVLADTCGNHSFDKAMLSSGLHQFAAELKGRVWAAPGSKAFGTHVSNADLIGLWSAWPSTAVVYWLGFWQDCLTAFQDDLRSDC